MKNKILLSAILLVFAIMSFKGRETNKQPALVKGTYGVSESYTYLKLILNEDQTFHYINTTNAKKPIDVKGNWELNGNTIYLKNYKSVYSMSSKWKIDKKCGCLKSRNQLEFTRICPINK